MRLVFAQGVGDLRTNAFDNSSTPPQRAIDGLTLPPSHRPITSPLPRRPCSPIRLRRHRRRSTRAPLRPTRPRKPAAS